MFTMSRFRFLPEKLRPCGSRGAFSFGNYVVDSPKGKMNQVSSRLRRVTGAFIHWCPGCGEMHRLPDGWKFDGNLETPTFSPSFKHEGVQTVKVSGKWTGEWVRDASGKPAPFVCHYILTAGILNFCADSTHSLAGKAVPLPQLPEGLADE